MTPIRLYEQGFPGAPIKASTLNRPFDDILAASGQTAEAFAGFEASGAAAAARTVASVSINGGASVLTAPLGSISQLRAVPRNAAGEDLTHTAAAVTWSISSNTVAHIDPATGYLAAVAVGVATATATIEGVTAAISITVEDDGAREMVALFQSESNGREMTVEWVADSSYYVWFPVKDTTYWVRFKMRRLSNTFMWDLIGWEIFEGFSVVSSAHSSMTYTGTWATPQNTSLAVGEWNHYHTGGNTRYVQFTAVAPSDGELWIVHARKPVGGRGDVTIDGSTSLVNVNGTGLTYIDMYAADEASNWRTYTKIASGLTPGQSYTVRLTGSSTLGAGGDDRMYFSGWAGLSPVTTNRTFETVSSERLHLALGPAIAVVEYALAIWPQTGTSADAVFSGMSHANEANVGAMWLDERGEPIVVNTKRRRAGAQSVTLRQSGYTRHPNTGTTNLAAVTVEHRWSADGLQITHDHDVLVPFYIGNGYMAMLAISDELDRGQVAGDTGVAYVLSADTGTSYGMRKSRAAAMWDTGHPWAVCVEILGYDAFDEWVYSVKKTWIQDRSPAGTNKIYFEFNNSALPRLLPVGKRLRNVARYRTGYFPAGAVLPL